MMKIFIADDHSGMRNGIRQMITQEFPEAFFGEASNGTEAISELIKDTNWDLVILDVSMPGKTGIEVLKEIRLKAFSKPVFIMSMHNSTAFKNAASKAGAAAYIEKSNLPGDLIQAIKDILRQRATLEF